ncbi:uncharacterized protein LOC108734996 [Agrilus planipennis]|uniref:Uncharacterized protein LOC108734996 n=1 Tax=Agrilus planipennis TaxID=224129 RepID=A0A7F5QZ43_AGRPL|nr:uncharacterized protein LOC108734996 [Agrilus planipennis]
MESVQFLILVLATVLNIPSSNQITVTFGTNTGPISVPATPVPPIVNRNARKVPAPVYEVAEDVPNPYSYKPIIPRQYRAKLLSFSPNPNLILGTPLDQKYTFNYDKYNLYEKQQALGRQYRGPHVFDKQDYELLRKSIKTAYQKNLPAYNGNNNYADVIHQRKTVPEIGIVYSSGVKYYVPQIVYKREDEEDLNSVYDHDDVKYYTKDRK